MTDEFGIRLIQALKDLDKAICAAPRETWAPDPKARMTWQRDTLRPALVKARSLIEEFEGVNNE